MNLVTATNEHIGDPNLLDTISSMNLVGAGFAGLSNSITFVSGHTLSGGTVGFGAASLTTVPEPTAALLLGLGLVGLAIGRRHQAG